MCIKCSGIGRLNAIKVDMIVDMEKSLNDGAFLFSAFAKGGWYFTIYEASNFFDMDLPLKDYDEETLELLLYGEKQKIKVPTIGGKDTNAEYEGVINKFDRLYVSRDLSAHSEKTQKNIDEYTHNSKYPECSGLRFNKEKRECLINGESIASVGEMELSALRKYLTEIEDESIVIDQKGLHATRHSNIATYTGIFDRIRTLFAKGGCPSCKGNGVIFTDLAYLEGVESICPECHGQRYLAEVLEMRYQDKTIMDVLELSLEDAVEFFTDKVIVESLQTLINVGVSYLILGQPLDTLSGGECQRIKLAAELHKKGEIYILDEPTTGLHMSDIEVLMVILNKLVDNGSTVILIEHNVEVMRQADYIIDMGPGAGHLGGEVIYTGIPSKLKGKENSLTAQYVFNKYE